MNVNISDIKLAAIIAIATAVGGALVPIAGSIFTDAGTARQANVQLIQLAIGILSEPLSDGAEDKSEIPSEKTALRQWAVDTINNSAEIKFDKNSINSLVNGNAVLPWASTLSDLKAHYNGSAGGFRALNLEDLPENIFIPNYQNGTPTR